MIQPNNAQVNLGDLEKSEIDETLDRIAQVCGDERKSCLIRCSDIEKLFMYISTYHSDNYDLILVILEYDLLDILYHAYRFNLVHNYMTVSEIYKDLHNAQTFLCDISMYSYINLNLDKEGIEHTDEAVNKVLRDRLFIGIPRDDIEICYKEFDI